jgi:hypothetical protein
MHRAEGLTLTGLALGSSGGASSADEEEEEVAEEEEAIKAVRMSSNSTSKALVRIRQIPDEDSSNYINCKTINYFSPLEPINIII